MASVNELEQGLKNNELASIYLLYGKEDYLKENAIKKIKKNFGETVEGLNYIKIDDTNLSALISELQTPSFGYPKKLIIVSDSCLLVKQDKKKKNAEEQDKIAKFVEFLNNNMEDVKDNNILVFVNKDIEKNDLFKCLETNGVVCNFEQQKLPELMARMKFICSAYHVEIDNYTLSYFIECCGTDLQVLINEIRKLIENVGSNGKITKELIDKLSIKELGAVIFDLTDSMRTKAN